MKGTDMNIFKFVPVITRATYQRQVIGEGAWLGEEPIDLEAECFQDSGSDFGSDVIVIWTDATLEKLASLGLGPDELVGATEVMGDAFWNERDARRQQATEVVTAA